MGKNDKFIRNDLHKKNLYAYETQAEINKCKNECFDILQHNERVQEFKEIYQKKFGIELTDGEALEYATILINFAKLMIRLSKNKN